MISDLDMLKQILVKDFDNFSDHAVSLVCPSCCFRPLEICRRAWLYCNYDTSYFCEIVYLFL